MVPSHRLRNEYTPEVDTGRVGQDGVESGDSEREQRDISVRKVYLNPSRVTFDHIDGEDELTVTTGKSGGKKLISLSLRPKGSSVKEDISLRRGRSEEVLSTLSRITETTDGNSVGFPLFK